MSMGPDFFYLPLTVFLAAFVCSQSLFGVGLAVLECPKPASGRYTILLSLLNAAIMSMIICFLRPVFHPLATLCLLAILIHIELAVFTKDGFRVHLFMVTGLFFIGSVLCSLLLVLTLQIGPDVTDAIPLPMYNRAIHTLWFLSIALYFFAMQHSPLIQMSNFKELIHAPARRRALFWFLLCFDIASILGVLSLIFLRPAQASADWMRILLCNMVIKDVLALVSSGIIIYMQCRIVGATIQTGRYQSVLDRERFVRTRAHRNQLMQFVVNVTNNTIEEGRSQFVGADDTASPAWTQILLHIVRKAVHPDDRQKFDLLGEKSFYEEQLAKGKPFYLHFRVSPLTFSAVLNLDDAANDRLLKSTYQWIHVSASGTVVQDNITNDIMMYVAVEDVDDDVRREERLLTGATRDSLTNLLNRSAAHEQIDMTIADGINQGILFIFDLDNFKRVNDELGHPAGDQLLRDSAAVLRTEFRPSDIVSRLGGDEFLVFAAEMDDLQSITDRALSVGQKLRHRFPSQKGDFFQVSASIGMAMFPVDGASYEELYAKADLALYEAKESGKDTFRIYRDAANQ